MYKQEYINTYYCFIRNQLCFCFIFVSLYNYIHKYNYILYNKIDIENVKYVQIIQIISSSLIQSRFLLWWWLHVLLLTLRFLFDFYG